HHRFRERRVRVHNVAEFFGGRLQADGDAGLGQQVGRVWTDDVNAQDFVVLCVGDDFYEAVRLAEDFRLAERREGELADLDFIALLLRLRFGVTDAADLGEAVSAVRHVQVIDRARILPGDVFRRQTAFLRGDVGEPRGWDHVADGVNVRLGGAHKLINLDVAALHL